VSEALRAHRLVAIAIVAVLLAVATGAVVLSSAGATDAAARDGVLDPGPVTVRIDVDHSRFETRPAGRPIQVRPHTEVRFVVVNHDPIGHELIVGGPDVQARHANGHEAYHPPVPGEVSVPADGRASTTYVFHAPGPVEYACHLPRHYEYGMHGIVEVVADEPAR
jgi:uncharacterized cupredoxin-like copper-binding protein